MSRLPVRRAPFVAPLLVALGLAGLTACQAIERPRRSANRAGIEGAAQRFGDRIVAFPPSAEDASPRLRDFMVRRGEIQSASLVMTDETGERLRLAAAVERRAGRLHDAEPPQDMREVDWFETARLLGRPTWTIAEFVRGSVRAGVVTFAVPLYRDGEFIGVAAVHLPSN